MLKNKLSLAVIMIAMMLCASCTKKQDYMKLVPKEAAVVAQFDVADLLAQSSLADNTTFKDLLTKEIDRGHMSDASKAKMKEVLQDPMAIGVDLTQPMVVFAWSAGGRDNFGYVAALSDADKFKETVELVLAEGGEDAKLQTTDGITYYMSYEGGVFFDENSVFLGNIGKDQRPEAFASQIAATLKGDGKDSFGQTEDAKRLASCSGQVQVMVTEQGMAYLANQLPVKELNGVKVTDFGMIADLRVTDGELALTYQAFSTTDAGAKYLAECDSHLADIEGSLCKYIPEASAAILANADSKYLLENVQKSGLLGNNPEIGEMFTKVLSSVNGEMAAAIYGSDPAGRKPEACFYVKTSDETIIDLAKETMGQALEPTPDGALRFEEGHTFEVDSEGDRDYSKKIPVYVQFKQQDGTFGLDWNMNPAPFKAADKPLSADVVKGKKLWIGCSAQLIKNVIATSFSHDEKAQIANQFAEKFESLSCVYEGEGKVVFTLKMADPKANPLASVADKMVELFTELAAK